MILTQKCSKTTSVCHSCTLFCYKCPLVAAVAGATAASRTGSLHADVVVGGGRQLLRTMLTKVGAELGACESMRGSQKMTN